MLVVTWNVNSVIARLDFVLDFLETRRPDIVRLQELKVEDDAFPALAFAQAGYSAATFGQKHYNGVGVLVRKEAGAPPEVVQRGLLGQEDAGARVITVRALGLSVTSVYVPNGKATSHRDYQAKLVWLDALVDHLDRTLDPTAPTVIGGDFNVAPADIDSWHPSGFAGHLFHTEPERERFFRLLAPGKYKDLFREKNPDLQAFSWWDYRAGAFHKKQGLRIDFLLGSASVLERCESVRIDRDFRKKRSDRIPSDHAPVIAELRGEAITPS